jgi:hypothetical protein
MWMQRPVNVLDSATTIARLGESREFYMSTKIHLERRV